MIRKHSSFACPIGCAVLVVGRLEKNLSTPEYQLFFEHDLPRVFHEKSSACYRNLCVLTQSAVFTGWMPWLHDNLSFYTLTHKLFEGDQHLIKILFFLMPLTFHFFFNDLVACFSIFSQLFTWKSNFCVICICDVKEWHFKRASWV